MIRVYVCMYVCMGASLPTKKGEWMMVQKSGCGLLFIQVVFHFAALLDRFPRWFEGYAHGITKQQTGSTSSHFLVNLGPLIAMHEKCHPRE